MKLTALLLIVAILNVSAKGVSQTVTFSAKNASLVKVFESVEQQTGYVFLYPDNLLSNSIPVSIEAKELPLTKFLDGALKGQPYSYSIKKKTIVIAPTGGLDPRLVEPHFSAAMTPPITGRITDAEGNPVAGVSVTIKGTKTGTTTDANGNFSLNAGAGLTLVISSVEFETREIKVGEETNLVISLIRSVSGLDEVVVNKGYYKESSRLSTGSVGRITSKEIEKQPVANPLQAMQGRMPGLSIVQTSGVPGTGLKVQIRGQNSLRNTLADNGNLPLYVVDGVPIDANPVPSTGRLLLIGGIDPLNMLNPANIESIEVLKDADATAIYGSRGANGVMLITTKKGKSGGMQVDVRAYTGTGRVSGKVDVMNTEQYLTMRNEAFTNDNATPKAGDYDVNGTWSQTRNIDWQKELVGGTANLTDIQTSISGGSEMTSFRAGVGVHRQSTVFPGNFGYNKVMANVNFNHAIPNKKFTVTFSANYGLDNNKLFDRNIIQDAMTLPPNAPWKDEQGELDWTGYSTNLMHPLSYFKIAHTSKSAALIANTVLRYQIIKGLYLGTSLGYTDLRTDQMITVPKSSMHPNQIQDSRCAATNSSSHTWIAEPQMSYMRQLGRGTLDVVMGATWQESQSHTLAITATGFLSDNLLGNLRAARVATITGDDKATYRYNAFFGRLGYNWNEKYNINLTARRDGSSRFGPENQFGTFGAIGAAWILSQEDFLKNNTLVSFAKLRSSYGTTGSDYVGNYAFMSTFTPSSGTYSGTTILHTTALSNPDFGWEVNKKFEAALELGFFKDRIRFATSWYRNRSSNQLVGYPLPTTTGFNTVQYNLDATVQNTGWEFELHTINFESVNGVRWRSSFNVTLPRNKLVAYPGIESSSYANTYSVGEPLTINKRFHLNGINPTTGLYEVLDADNNGSITLADRTTIINIGRTMFGGIQNSIAYKKWSLEFLIEVVKQKSSDYMGLFHASPGVMYNQPASLLEQQRWQTEGDQAEIQKFTQAALTPYSRVTASDVNQTDASFMRMKTISIVWTLPKEMMNILKNLEASIYVQAQNLFTITRYPGLNPEFPANQLPPLRVLSVGVNLKF